MSAGLVIVAPSDVVFVYSHGPRLYTEADYQGSRRLSPLDFPLSSFVRLLVVVRFQDEGSSRFGLYYQVSVQSRCKHVRHNTAESVLWNSIFFYTNFGEIW